MTKLRLIITTALALTLFGSCQSLQQISIDYLVPGELSFPNELRKVAIVNNTSKLPDNKLIIKDEQANLTAFEIGRAVTYGQGNPTIGAESLAKEIANQNYFEEVVLCDSALRKADIQPRETQLSPLEVNQLSTNLGVDFIIALENIQLKANKSLRYLPAFSAYQTIVDATAYPTIAIYVPNRSKPMTVFTCKDSLSWEAYGDSESSAISSTIPDTAIIRIVSDFSGTIPVKKIVPHWKTVTRSLYASGTVAMRDAAVYVREENWEAAYQLWNDLFKKTKSTKKKMYTAFNIAIYYEIQDNLQMAKEWASKALTYAKRVDKVDKKISQSSTENQIPNYFMIMLYLQKLEERLNNLTPLNLQMSRFENDF
ncbi:MAG: tetratricopeptide repeat protein [Bacteroidia bacterium]|nr:tetratricopeptide repeat protein [Bacteroidia bacterium]